MKQSLFKRYFTIFGISLVLSIFLLGMILLYFAARYFITDRQNMLFSVAAQAEEYTVESYLTNGFVDRTRTEKLYGLLAQSTDSIVLYADNDGVIRMCSEGSDCAHRGTSINSQIIELIRTTGEYRESGLRTTLTSGSIKYTVGVGTPVWVDETHIAGYIFVFTPMTALRSFLGDIFAIIQFASLVMIVAVGLVMYYTIRRVTDPLSEIAHAAVCFGNGDFSMRVTVRGDDEIAGLAKTFNKMADDIVEIEATRRSFVANVSHELRTPMTTIGGYIDGILDGTIPKNRQNEYLQIVSDEVKRLARLTSSTLAVAKLDEGNVSVALEDINVWNIVCTVMFSMEKRISAKSITVSDFSPCEAYARCDSDMLHQVIYNLVDNAVKFTPENGEITISVTQDKQNTAFAIRNTGVGIPKDELPYVFDRFYKTDKSRGLDKTGSGLGLYIVKTLVQRMNGDVRVESSENHYCTFTVLLENGTPPDNGGQPAPKEGIISRLGKQFTRKSKTKKDTRENGGDSTDG